MPVMQVNQLLAQERIQRFVEDRLIDIRNSPAAPMTWLSRVPVVPAVDRELIGKVTGNVYMADIVADDAKAAMKPAGKVRLVSHKIPNIKHGTPIDQEELNTLEQIQRLGAGANSPELASFDRYVAGRMSDLIDGCTKRVHFFICAMIADEMDYDQGGIKLENMTFGMPSDLKFAPSTPWSTSGSATPIDDIMEAIQYAADKYGIVYNRLTMSRISFAHMIATTEFQNKAALYMPAGTGISALPLTSVGAMKNLASQMLDGVEIEFDDSSAAVINDAGEESFVRYMPEQYAILSSTAFDGDRTVWDFGNSTVTESILSSLLGGASTFGQIPMGPGPVGYAAPMTIDANPPQLGLWAVQRGFPRRHVQMSNARITTHTPA